MRSLTRTTRRHTVIAVSAACLLVPLAACTPDDGPRPAASAASTGGAASHAPKDNGKRDGRGDEELSGRSRGAGSQLVIDQGCFSA